MNDHEQQWILQSGMHWPIPRFFLHGYNTVSTNVMYVDVCFRYGLNKYCDSGQSILIDAAGDVFAGVGFLAITRWPGISRYGFPVSNESNQCQFELYWYTREQKLSLSYDLYVNIYENYYIGRLVFHVL